MGTDEVQQAGLRPRVTIEPGTYSAIYAVGDVHGCLEPLLALEDKIKEDASLREGRKLIVMLGDYIDRGPQSAAVLYHLSAAPPVGFDRICLRGNHDDAFLDYLKGDPAGDWYLEHGADTTLQSYGLDVEAHGPFVGSNFALRQAVRAVVPASHIEFLEATAVMVAVGADVFVHAGVRPGRPLAEQEDEDLLWIRRSFLDLGPGLPVRVFHGHTPLREAFVSPERVSLDTHCYKSGRLTAARLSDGVVEILSVG